MYSLHIGDGRFVKAIFIVSMDLKVWQSGFVTGSRHQITAVAHKVVVAFVKGGVVGITRCYACGCTYVKQMKNCMLALIFLQTRFTGLTG